MRCTKCGKPTGFAVPGLCMTCYNKQKNDSQMYALYKGDEFVTMGTIPEIARYTDKTIAFIKYMRTPSYEKRCADAKKRLRLLPLDEEEDKA